MKTLYFTFGQNHRDERFGVVFDKNIVVKITADDPRGIMFAVFGRQWSMQYGEPPPMHLFPRGIYDFNASLEAAE